METNLRRDWNRVFVVLTVMWAVYVLLVYPMQQLARAEKIEKSAFLSCWESRAADFKGCADYARLKGLRSVGATFLLPAVVVVLGPDYHHILLKSGVNLGPLGRI